MKKISIFILSTLLILVSCRKDESTPEVIPDDEVKNVCLIHNQDVYLFTELNKEPVRLTSTPSILKTRVCMSYDHEKIAYLEVESDKIVVLDRTGNVLEEIEDFTQIKDFGWCGNNQTLYVLNGGSLEFHGPAVNVPAVTQAPSAPSGAGMTLKSVAISAQGDLAYTLVWNYAYLDPWLVYTYGSAFIRKSADGQEEYVQEHENPNVYNFDVDFVGNGSSYTSGGGIYKDLGGTEHIDLPGGLALQYNADLELVFGYLPAPNDPVKYFPTLMNMQGGELRKLNAFTANGANLWTDWK